MIIHDNIYGLIFGDLVILQRSEALPTTLRGLARGLG